MLLMTLLVSAALAAAQSGAEPEASSSTVEPADRISKAEAEAALANCGSRRFETAAVGLIDGKMRRTRLNLCAADEDSDEEWIGTLERAATSVESQAALPDNVKQKLLTDLRGEIARLKGPVVVVPVTADITPRARPSGDAPKSDFQVSPLPDFPVPPRPSPALGSGSASAAAGASGAAASLSSGPWVMIRCRAPGDPVEGTDCARMLTDTMLLVTALQDIPAQSALRFSRDGAQAEHLLAGGLRRGQRLQLKLPKRICARVFRTDFEVDVLVRGTSGGITAADHHGPFQTRC